MLKKSFVQFMVLVLLVAMATACGTSVSSSDVNECVKTGVSKSDCEKAMKEIQDLQKAK
ncbi:hypothetical protein SAMN03159341_10957 [Paenibacillus sp. 1_12]|uniref:hypothetical protein n=1 Tax=Paenibacillus sp. 1_12 TaxID=1566278 RepID=UPI0008E0D1E0|nr:hypothetical protein [Paenibacillus sp. 1_12]SFL73389.1 hypothetical protein SAMN03159341_10957 [Paenibacillus sp. 1_12]